MLADRGREHGPERGSRNRSFLLGVDVGGTFTDGILVVPSGIVTSKAPSTPDDQSVAVMTVIGNLLEAAGIEARDISYFAHGMTVATNALLEERGARSALVTTCGFEDVVEIGRQARPELYDPCAPLPRPLVPRSRRFGVVERQSASGVEIPLDEDSVRSALEAVGASGVESLAICLLFSFLDPSHERRIAELAKESLPEIHVSCAHDVTDVFREYERCSTTVIDAYLSPLLGGYVGNLTKRASASGLPEPAIMQSSGGVCPAPLAARHASWTLLSGPAGGAVAAEMLGRLAGYEHVLGFDMGGTSCDVCEIDRSGVRRSSSRTVAGRHIELPLVDIHTVGAGGGSVAWRDSGGALRVGPRSAGARPGPACYGAGGDEPTVTDANLVLGYLAAGAALAGDLRLDPAAARRAVGTLGESLGLDIEETAAGIVRVVNQEMVRALRVVTVNRGLDPRRYALLAFGGAGPMHAAGVAAELGVGTVICPRASGVLSALGLVTSERRRDLVRSVMLRGETLTGASIEGVVSELSERGRRELGGGEARAGFDMRYRGQSFELPVDEDVAVDRLPDPDALRSRFEALHEERFGYRDSEGEVEIVNIRVAVTIPATKPDLLAGTEPSGPESKRPALFAGAWADARIVHGDPIPGESVEGPTIYEMSQATVVVPPGWRGTVDEVGTLILVDGGGP